MSYLWLSFVVQILIYMLKNVHVKNGYFSNSQKIFSLSLDTTHQDHVSYDHSLIWLFSFDCMPCCYEISIIRCNISQEVRFESSLVVFQLSSR